MRTIALRAAVFCSLLSVPLHAGAEATPYTQLAKLASFLSDGDSVSALESFDKNMSRYGAIAEDLQALVAQAEVLCSIDVVADKEADDEASAVHHLDLDWYMTLKSKMDGSIVESRRMRVAVTMQRSPAKSGSRSPEVWRITSLSPEQILAPLAIK